MEEKIKKSQVSNNSSGLRRSRTLVRILPKLGHCSRSLSYDLIRSGRVKVNGVSVTDPNKNIRSSDKITVDNARAKQKKLRYILLNKPAGYVTTRSDEQGRPTVYDILGDVGDWLFPVGRLDKDTEGLLIFTNDTVFGNRLTDPENRIPRTYIATVEGVIRKDDERRALRGIDIGRGEMSNPIGFKVLAAEPTAAVVELTLTAGKNREVRRLFEAMGASVKRLVRTSFGPFSLIGINPGEWREI